MTSHKHEKCLLYTARLKLKVKKSCSTVAQDQNLNKNTIKSGSLEAKYEVIICVKLHTLSCTGFQRPLSFLKLE